MVQCGACGQENPHGAIFCDTCGSPLETSDEVEYPLEPMPTPGDTPADQLQALQEEVRQLKDYVREMDERLSALERTQPNPAA